MGYGGVVLGLMKIASDIVKLEHPEGCPLNFDVPVQTVICGLTHEGINVSCLGRRENDIGNYLEACGKCKFLGKNNIYKIER